MTTTLDRMVRGTFWSVLVSLPRRRQRYVLYYLVRRQKSAPAEVETLARNVAAWERDTSVEAAPDDHAVRVLDALTTSHLPTMASYGLVEYDPLSGLVGTPEYTAFAGGLLDVLARVELHSGVRPSNTI